VVPCSFPDCWAAAAADAIGTDDVVAAQQAAIAIEQQICLRVMCGLACASYSG
jgi:hypothetical protein